MAKTIKIILIEHAYLLAAGLESLVNELNGVFVEHVYHGGENHLTDKVLGHKPDLIIFDPHSVGEQLLSIVKIFQQEPDIKLVGLLSSKAPDHVKSRFAHHLNRDDCKFDLLENLKKIIGNSLEKGTSKNATLSNREIELLKQVCIGLTNQEIADKLFLSVHTVMTHRKNITKKLGIKTVSGLTVYALMNNLVDIREVENRS
jgi:DNA-binding NarL/FixJ family response regulator